MTVEYQRRSSVTAPRTARTSPHHQPPPDDDGADDDDDEGDDGGSGDGVDAGRRRSFVVVDRKWSSRRPSWLVDVACRRQRSLSSLDRAAAVSRGCSSASLTAATVDVAPATTRTRNAAVLR